MKQKANLDYLFPIDTTKFGDAVTLEKKMQPLADDFYKFLNALQVKRYSWNNKKDRYMQLRDVDCSIQLEAQGIEVFWLNISEKFRRDTFDNFCIEVWSNLEKRHDGWATQEGSAADVYLSISPYCIYSIWRNADFIKMMKEIKDFLTPEQIKSYDWGDKKILDIEIDGHKMKLLKNRTKGKSGEEWTGICVIIPFDTLVNEYFVDINKYEIIEPHIYKRVK